MIRQPLIPTLAITLLSTAATASAQVGGTYQTFFQFTGPGNGSELGATVVGGGDIDNDGFPDLIIGAPGATANGAPKAGVVFVYSGASGIALFNIPGTRFGQNLGKSISGAGDINQDGFDDFMIGDPAASPGGLNEAGSVFLYSGASGNMILQVDGSIAGQRLGTSLANAGDVNADGMDDILIGSNSWVSFKSTVGVYSGASGSLIHKTTQPSLAVGYGATVSTAGDINADGHADFIVGAPFSVVNSESNVGSAFVYSGLTGDELYRIDGDGSEGYFGHDVASAGDVNADGHGDFIIGNSGNPVGKVEVRSGANNALLYSFLRTNADRVGESVAGIGDMNQDGFDDFIIGDPTNVGSNSPSNVKIYSGENGELLFRLDLGNRDELGYAVAGIGDLNGDGFPECIAGAPKGGGDRGTALVIGFNPHLTLSTDTVSASGGEILSMDFNFPFTTAFYEYKTLISATGTGPTNYGVDIPLTADSLTVDSFNGIYPVLIHSDLHGTLDADGGSTASMTIPAGLPSALIGRSFWIAAIAMQPGGLPEHSSVARTVTITP